MKDIKISIEYTRMSLDYIMEDFFSNMNIKEKIVNDIFIPSAILERAELPQKILRYITYKIKE